MLATLLADIALHVGAIGAVLEVVATGSGQSGLQRCRPSLVGSPTAAAGSTGTFKYVALGDSYAAGVGGPTLRLRLGQLLAKQ